MTSSTLRERYSVVASTLALVLALGATGAYAAGKITAKDLARGAVTSKAVKDGAVTGVDLKNGTLTGQDVKDGALAGADLKNGSVGAADLVPGTLPKVPAGPSAFVGGGATAVDAPQFCCYGTASVTLTAPARVLVVMTVHDITLGCSAAGSCSLNMGAYVRPDGGDPVAVPGAGRNETLSASTSRTYERTMSGVIDLPAGTHELGLGFGGAGNTGGYGGGTSEMLAVVLGNAPGSPTGSPVRPGQARVPVVGR